jgi:hypothetical protein
MMTIIPHSNAFFRESISKFEKARLTWYLLMPIKPNAASDEKNSPHYLANEKLCTEWDDYILKKNGNLNGVYNAWSFTIKAIVKTNFTWRIKIIKATHYSGSFWFSSKYQALREIMTFTTTIPKNDCKDFSFRKSRFRGRSEDHLFAKALMETLKYGMIDESLYEVQFQNSELKIVFQHKNNWFEMVDKILEFEYKDESDSINEAK